MSEPAAMRPLAGRVALITGSARGIGRAIAERYASLGADVVVNYAADEEDARQAVSAIEEMGARAVALYADVTKVADLDHLFAEGIDRLGRPDIVVANAGLELTDQPVLDFTEADFDRVFSLNTRGAFFTLQRAAQHVADNGRIIYIGSSLTAFPLPGRGLYAGSKAGPLILVEVLAKEIGGRGVTVNSILPTATERAGVHTDGVRPAVAKTLLSLRPIKRMGTLEDVANAAEYLASDLSSFVSGQHLLVSGGAPA